jgi:nucleotide-binding universal stress UspA family protein
MNRANTITAEKEPRLKSTRIRLERVLVAVDLAVSSSNTLSAAAELAQRFGSQLIVAHVLDPSQMRPSETVNDMEETLRLWVKPYVTEGTQCIIEVVEGNFVKEMEALAGRYKADLLVIGTHSVSGVKRFVFGSRAEALYRQISIPVLTVGSHVHIRKAAFASILLPTDLKPHSLRAAQYAVSISEESNAKLTLVHARERHEEPDAIMSRMRQLVSEDAALWCTPEFRTADGDPTDAILRTATELNADLIVLGVTHYRPLADHNNWSIASKVVTNADCPVLTVRDHF